MSERERERERERLRGTVLDSLTLTVGSVAVRGARALVAESGGLTQVPVLEVTRVASARIDIGREV